MTQNTKVTIIGSGFAGLSAACFLAKEGYNVTVVEKHDTPGGRARHFKADGFTFDMGPSWYWMPDVFERFFNQFGKKVSDYYSLIRLDPSYRVYWDNEYTDIPANYDELKSLFESLEPGSAAKLDQFLKGAAFKYKLGIQKLVHKPGRSITEFLDMQLIGGVFKLDVFTSMRKHINKYFKHPKLRQLLEFPVLFLGAMAENTPALYSLMNYADIKLGTWYPRGGMYQIIEAMYQLALSLGVKFEFETEAKIFLMDNNNIQSIETNKGLFTSEIFLATADYHYVETQLLPASFRNYNEKYWDSRAMAPSCIIYYLGLNKRLKNIMHHDLFFDAPFEQHAREIYKDPAWPQKPLFYVSCPSQTDNTVAPPGWENLLILIPVSTNLKDDTEKKRTDYFDQIISRMEQHLQENIKDHIIYKRSYANSDFLIDYHAFKGNAYGLANTLLQTAILKPSLKSKKVRNLYFAGQLTVPGPGVPPTIISGEVAAKEITKDLHKRK